MSVLENSQNPIIQNNIFISVPEYQPPSDPESPVEDLPERPSTQEPETPYPNIPENPTPEEPRQQPGEPRQPVDPMHLPSIPRK